jgi:hypothetical protein
MGMNVLAGSTSVSTYFSLRLSATGDAATGLTIANIDLTYVRSGAAPAAKVDAIALAATNSAWAANKAIEIDATNQPGLYRVDWPDAAFAAGVREVILSVKCATAFTEHLRVNLTPVPADVEQWLAATAPANTGDAYARLGAPVGASISADIANVTLDVATTHAVPAGIQPNHQALSFESMLTLSAGIALPTIPASACAVVITANTKDIRWRPDAVAPTATVGHLIPAGETVVITGNLADIRLIETSASATASVTYYGPKYT